MERIHVSLSSVEHKLTVPITHSYSHRWYWRKSVLGRVYKKEAVQYNSLWNCGIKIVIYYIVMSVARVYLPKDQKYKIVKTSSVLKLDPETFDSDDEKHKKRLYQLKEGNEKSVCQVLRIRGMFFIYYIYIYNMHIFMHCRFFHSCNKWASFFY